MVDVIINFVASWTMNPSIQENQSSIDARNRCQPIYLRKLHQPRIDSQAIGCNNDRRYRYHLGEGIAEDRCIPHPTFEDNGGLFYSCCALRWLTDRTIMFMAAV